MRGDGRSRRVAVVSDAVVNPADGERSTLLRLADEGWGLVQLPPPDLDPDARREAMAAAVEALEAFAREGYALAALVDDADRRALLEAAGPSLAAPLAAAPPPA